MLFDIKRFEYIKNFSQKAIFFTSAPDKSDM